MSGGRLESVEWEGLSLPMTAEGAGFLDEAAEAYADDIAENAPNEAYGKRAKGLAEAIARKYSPHQKLRCFNIFLMGYGIPFFGQIRKRGRELWLELSYDMANGMEGFREGVALPLMKAFAKRAKGKARLAFKACGEEPWAYVIDGKGGWAIERPAQMRSSHRDHDHEGEEHE